MKQELLKKFEEVFGDSKGAGVYYAPGRVNLIGEQSVHMQLQDFVMMTSYAFSP